jgi:hypothetical protein
MSVRHETSEKPGMVISSSAGGISSNRPCARPGTRTAARGSRRAAGERDLLDAVRAVDLTQDRQLGRAELLHVHGPDQLGYPAGVRDALAAPQPLVLATHPLEDQQVVRDVERLEALCREDVLEEAEVALLPQEELVDRLLGLDLEDVLEVLPGQPAHDHQQLAHQGAVGLLHVEQLLDLSSPRSPADQVVTEELLGL